jgi:hypothetical protein
LERVWLLCLSREHNGGFAVDENPTLSEAVFNSISDWLSRDSESTMLTGFVLALTGIGEDGGVFYETQVAHQQPRSVSLGLIAIADETVREDLRTDMMVSRMSRGDE